MIKIGDFLYLLSFYYDNMNHKSGDGTKKFFEYLGYLGILIGVVGIILLLLKIINVFFEILAVRPG